MPQLPPPRTHHQHGLGTSHAALRPLPGADIVTKKVTYCSFFSLCVCMCVCVVWAGVVVFYILIVQSRHDTRHRYGPVSKYIYVKSW